MPSKIVVFALMRFVHDLATAAWIGGMIVLAAGLLPALRRTLGMGPNTKALISAVQRRYGPLVYASIAALFATGLLMVRRNPQIAGFLNWSTPESALMAVKHLLVLVMVLLTVLRSLIVRSGGRAAAAGVGVAGAAGKPAAPAPAATRRERIGVHAEVKGSR